MATDRFADRDMIMRYHWGIGIGHTYSHGICLSTHPSTESIPSETHDDSPANLNHSGSLAPADEDTDSPALNSELDVQDEDPSSSSDNESELGLGSEDSEEWQDVPEELDDEEYLELYNTYHTDY